MTRQDFENFVDTKSSAAKSTPESDWGKKKESWLKCLGEFFKTIERYLKPYVESGKLQISKGTIKLNEEHLGTYEAETRTIVLGADEIELSPVGTLILGASGRVDLVGPEGTVKIILTGKNSSGLRISVRFPNDPEPVPPEIEPQVWKLVSAPPNIQFTELSEESFFDAVMEVAHD